jgi:mono/diheme cytochrome c family protein
MLMTLPWLAGGCDVFLADNPRQCEKNPGACGADERCSRVTNACVKVPAVLRQPSRSSTIALSEDDSRVVMVNPEDGSISVFRSPEDTLVARVPVGGEPSSVVLHPDRRTGFVANRADAQVVRVRGLDGAAPQVDARVDVGAEPTGLALSPSGALLFVAEWAEDRITVIDTEFMRPVKTLPLRAPRALAVTNSGDLRDDDEVLVAPEFYGVPVGEEASNRGRTGKVRLYSLATLAEIGAVDLSPLSIIESGIGAEAAANQLAAVAVQGRRFHVTALAASPEGPLSATQMVAPALYIGEIDGAKEVQDGAGTVGLVDKINNAGIAAGKRLFLADPSDVVFVPGKADVAYIVARGADAVQRLEIDQVRDEIRIGSTVNKQIDLRPDAGPACPGPTGMAVVSPERAYLNCWLDRSLGVVDLRLQRLSAVVRSAELPQDPAQRGRQAFYSARGALSTEARSSCASCHPDGLSDGITWSFPTGPRQTPALDGTFSHGQVRKQRALGWTATADEVHDFESVLRAASGGAGLIMKDRCGGAQRVDLAQSGLEAPGARESQGAACTSWNDIEAYLQGLRPPRGRRGLDPALVAAGRAVFEGKGQCQVCHGGAGFTVSRLFYTPGAASTALLRDTVDFRRPAAWPESWNLHNGKQMALQPKEADGGQAIGPLQLACAIRNVGTFGELFIERTVTGGRAQGRGGYNVPALYGLSLGAPYLHHRQARTLEDLFSREEFLAHGRAGAANFLGDASAAADRRALIAFLLSIDAGTSEIGVPAGFDEGCKTSN